ncbi:hypothetical protein F0562_013518 [Nyssa sinensis]|uniref:LYR motif containing domain-containing protein n=1 Tax=Nyssa sinensis TaxID=561372 RepID=A0A5J4ZP46_9ASTE|nr:hypothetical protein F0562_013518 [Nyssa sinensis]
MRWCCWEDIRRELSAQQEFFSLRHHRSSSPTVSAVRHRRSFPPSPISASTKMATGLIWATTEDLSRNRGRVLSLYRQILRSLNSPDLPLSLAARLAKKAQVRAIFLFASEERSLHNIDDLIDTAEYSLSLLRKGEIPKYTSNSSISG